MKKWVGIIIVLCIGGCAALYVVEERNKVIFEATIEEIHGDQAIVIDEKGSLIEVDLSVNRYVTFQEGDKVLIGYNGAMEESYPAKIRTLSVELVDE